MTGARTAFTVGARYALLGLVALAALSIGH